MAGLPSKSAVWATSRTAAANGNALRKNLGDQFTSESYNMRFKLLAATFPLQV